MSSLHRPPTDIDLAKRQKMLGEISLGYMNDVALTPRFRQLNAWAAKKAMTFAPRIMSLAHAMTVQSA